MLSLSEWKRRLYCARQIATSPDAKKALLAAERCGRDWHILKSSDGSPRFVLMTCGRKFCPRCQERHTRRLRAGMLKAVKDIPPRQLRHLTLSLPNVPLGELKAGIQRLYACFRAWRDEGRREKHGAYWRDVAGWAWKLECRAPKNHGTWQPHLHVLLHCPRGFDLRKGDPGWNAWHRIAARATGRTCISLYVERCEDGEAAARGLVSYIFKHSVSYELTPTRLAEMAEAFHGVRFHQSGGSLRTPKVEAKPSPSEFHGTLLAELWRVKNSPNPHDAHEALAIVRAFSQAKANDPNAKAQAPPEVWDL